MKFSVIVPVYNVEKYLRQCIESILCQTFTDYELILVDDGSPDGSGKICDEFAEKDDRVKVIHKENGGCGPARNAGLVIAQGEYILMPDSDDFFLNELVLEKIARKSEENPDLIIYKICKCDEAGGNIKYVNDFSLALDSNTLPEMISNLLKTDSFNVSAWSKAIRLDLLIDCKIFFENIVSEDSDWYLDVMQNASTFCLLDEFVYVYRTRPGSITTAWNIKGLTDLIYILEKWQVKLPNDMDVNKMLKHYLAKVYTFALIRYALIKDSSKKVYKSKLKSFRSLLNYDLIKRVKIVNRFYNILGFNLTIMLLSIFFKLKG